MLNLLAYLMAKSPYLMAKGYQQTRSESINGTIKAVDGSQEYLHYFVDEMKLVANLNKSSKNS